MSASDQFAAIMGELKELLRTEYVTAAVEIRLKKVMERLNAEIKKDDAERAKGGIP